MIPTFVFDNPPFVTVPRRWSLTGDPFYFRKNAFRPNIASGCSAHELFSHGGLLIDAGKYRTKLTSDITNEDKDLYYLIEPWPSYLGIKKTYGPGFAMPINWHQIIQDIPDNIVTLAQQKRLTVILHIPEFTHDENIPEIANRITATHNEKNIPPESFKFVSGMKTKEFYFWPAFEYSQYNTCNARPTITQVNLNKRNKKFTCLNRIDKGHRRYIAYKLWEQRLDREGYFSYSSLGWNRNGVTQLSPAADVEWWHLPWDISSQQWIDFRNNDPHKADDDDPATHHNEHGRVIREHYEDAYWNFVTETSICKNTFLTEKTFKPIAQLQPFVIIGSYKSLDLLHDLGYKTFNQYIDESYDNISDPLERTKAATAVMLDLAQKSHEEHIDLMHKIKPILEHNQKHFFNSKYRLKNFVKYLHGDDKMYNWLKDCIYD